MQDIKKNFWLEKFDCFSITGKDARKFLNGITTGNILNSENKVESKEKQSVASAETSTSSKDDAESKENAES